MIRYKLLKAKLTGDVFPQQVETQPFSLKDLKEKLRKHYGAISAAVLDDAFSIIAQELGEGKTVSLDEFGSFSIRLGMSKKCVKNYEDVHTHDIKIKGVRFIPSKMLRRELNKQKIQLQQGEKQRRKITTDDRWAVLYNYVLERINNDFLPREEVVVTTSIYRHLTACTDYTARKELELFEKDGKLRRLHSGRVLLYVLAV